MFWTFMNLAILEVPSCLSLAVDKIVSEPAGLNRQEKKPVLLIVFPKEGKEQLYYPSLFILSIS